MLKIILKPRSIIGMLRENGTIKCSFKTTKGRKRVEDKNRKKEQGQQIENSKKYSRYKSNYINNQFECH